MKHENHCTIWKVVGALMRVGCVSVMAGTSERDKSVETEEEK